MSEHETPAVAPWRIWIEEHAFVVGIAGAVALLVSLVIAVVSLSGGSDTPVTADSTTTSTAVTTSTSAPDDPDDDTPAPTTSTTAVANTGDPLIAVKVDNAPQARPQIGLNSARLLFEAPVEGGMTRFLALFDPSDLLVGPVRSLRPVDVDLIPAVASTVVSTGGQPFVLGPLSANGADLIDFATSASPLQTLERPRPHHLFVNLSHVDALPSPWTPPEPTASEPTGEATSIAVPYAAEVVWTYSDGAYSRSEGGEPTVVLDSYGADPTPLTTDAVAVISVEQRSAGYQDAAGAEVPDFSVVGSGDFVMFTEGKVYEGTWSRAGWNDPFVFTGNDGNPIGLSARTFIHLLDRNLAVDY